MGRAGAGAVKGEENEDAERKRRERLNRRWKRGNVEAGVKRGGGDEGKDEGVMVEVLGWWMKPVEMEGKGSAAQRGLTLLTRHLFVQEMKRRERRRSTATKAAGRQVSHPRVR